MPDDAREAPTPIDSLTMHGGPLAAGVGDGLNTPLPIPPPGDDHPFMGAVADHVRRVIGRADAPAIQPAVDIPAAKACLDALGTLVDLEDKVPGQQAGDFIRGAIMNVKKALIVSSGIAIT